MHRHRLLIALASVTLVVSACGDDDDAANETVPGLPTGPVTTPTPTTPPTLPASTGPATVPETPAPITLPATTLPPTTIPATTVPATTTTTVPATTTTVPATTTTTTVPATTTTTTTTTTVPATTTTATAVPETTEAPETTVVETTLPPETTVVETTLPPETTVVETTLPPETTVAPDTTVLASSVPITDVFVLNQNGLGLVTFGDEPEAAIAAVTAVLGAPTEDTGWSEPLAISACSGTQVRRVSWGALSLYFGDESPIAQGTLHLFAYSYGNVEDLEATPAGLTTPEGIGLGTTVQFLRAAYPEVVVDPGEEGIIEPNFFVNELLSGRLTGGGDDDLVTAIIGGDACGV